MSTVFNEYPVNGVGPYSITFEYQQQEDVVVLYRNPTNERYEVQSNTDWSFENATTIKLNTAPSADYDKVRIQRSTDVNPLRALFYPGSAIRAQDLNANFEQLMMAIEEEQQSLTDTSDYIDQFFWNKLDNTVEEEDQTSGKVITDNLITDDHIFTTAASSARHDAYVSDTTPSVITSEQEGKIWNDTAALKDYFWDADNQAWVSFSKSGPQGVKGEKGDKGDKGEPGKVEEAPNDGQLYGRSALQNRGRWVKLDLSNSGGGGSTYNFIKPLKEDGTSVKIDLVLLSNA